jgi:CheY-like chemotaxis protein
MTSRMEATGRLAGGVAHDFNNLLTIIVSYAEMMLADRDDEAPDRGDLNQILEAGRSAANLTKQLLAFSRQQVIAPQHVDLESSVDRADSLLRRAIGEDIELVRVGGDIPTTVIIDPGQFEQVIINLAVNARDAMPRGGKLTIETRVDDVDEEFAQAHWPMKPGRFAVLAVADTGVGMDEATRRRVFEPFFTTKAPGQGTGLGLATVYGIVKQANGFVWVYSEPGIGTQFRIYLPLAEEQTESVTEPMDPCPLQGTERILLVEDSPSVRSVARRNLERFGYRVIEAPTAEAAIALAEAGVDLLLTDVVMPGLSGREVAEQIVERFPAVKVMFMSGYTDDAIVRHGVLSNEVGYLQKPFTGEALVRKVRAVLDGDTAHVSR